MNLLPLQSGILYGPINSRRLGKSLGVNLMPTGYKLCSFNCVYCHYGWTKTHAINMEQFVGDMPSFNDVTFAVESALRSNLEFDYLTFSGNGEPTLYPKFGSLVEHIAEIRDRLRTDLKIALLSNSSGLNIPEVRKCVVHIDMPVFKLDAGNDSVFKAINRPCPGVNFNDVVGYLRTMKGIIIQTVLVNGDPDNTDKEKLTEYFLRISEIHPQCVHVYSIDRPVPNLSIGRILPDKLEQMAELGTSTTGVTFKPFFVR